MKILIGIALLPSLLVAQPVRVRPYVNHRGVYHQPAFRTRPDRTPFNNYSARGNVNPYTARSGSKSPYNFRFRRRYR